MTRGVSCATGHSLGSASGAVMAAGAAGRDGRCPVPCVVGTRRVSCSGGGNRAAVSLLAWVGRYVYVWARSVEPGKVNFQNAISTQPTHRTHCTSATEHWGTLLDMPPYHRADLYTCTCIHRFGSCILDHPLHARTSLIALGRFRRPELARIVAPAVHGSVGKFQREARCQRRCCGVPTLF